MKSNKEVVILSLPIQAAGTFLCWEEILLSGICLISTAAVKMMAQEAGEYSLKILSGITRFSEYTLPFYNGRKEAGIYSLENMMYVQKSTKKALKLSQEQLH